MPWIAILSGLTTGQQRKEHGMEQGERSRKGKHLTREERIVIERMSRGGMYVFSVLHPVCHLLISCHFRLDSQIPYCYCLDHGIRHGHSEARNRRG